jgi:hypothetical protein
MKRFVFFLLLALIFTLSVSDQAWSRNTPPYTHYEPGEDHPWGGESGNPGDPVIGGADSYRATTTNFTTFDLFVIKLITKFYLTNYSSDQMQILTTPDETVPADTDTPTTPTVTGSRGSR